MPILIETYNWGNALRNQNPELTRQLSTAYTNTATCVNTKVSKNVADIDPPNAVTSDQVNKNYSIGDIWVNKTTDMAWIMTSRTSDVLVLWTLIT